MKRSLIPLITALAILAVACAGSDGSSTTTEPDTQTSDGSASDTSSGPSPDNGDNSTPEPSEPADPDDGPTPEPSEPADPDDDTPPPTLTASFRGVSADSIKLGISIFDLSDIGRFNGDVIAKYQTAIHAINDRGGVLGRRIEPVYAEFSPLDTATGDAACVYLTEDEEVFAVVGAQSADYVLCYTDLYDTIFISPRPLTAEQVARSSAPALSVAASGDRLVRTGIEALAAEGIFDGVSVAVHASSDGADQLELARQVLDELGVDVASQTVATDLGGDLVAIRAEMAVFAQRWDADGTDIVISVGDGGNLQVATALGDAGLDMTLAATQPAVDASVYENYGANLAGLEGAVTTSPLSFADMYEQDLLGVRECVTRFEEASGENVNIRPEAGEVANLTTTVWACQLTELFAQIAESAGADLTNESFLAAFESASNLQATALSSGSGGPGKWDIDDSLPAVLTWDAATGTFVSR